MYFVRPCTSSPAVTYFKVNDFVSTGQSFCPSETATITPYFNIPSGSVLESQWQVNGCTLVTSSKDHVRITAPSGIYASFTVQYRYRNACGWSAWATMNGSTRNCAGGEEAYSATVPSDGHNNYSVSPNPANSTLSITLESDRTTNLSTKSISSSYSIKFYDANGNLVKQATSQGENVELDVSSLPGGYYYLHIHNHYQPTK
jgi:hypothetical protein